MNYKQEINHQFLFDTAVKQFYQEKYSDAFTLFEKYSQEFDLTDYQLRESRQFQSKCIPHIKDKYITYYNDVNVNLDGPITFTITTCKRLDLFMKTMNSFMQCVKDKYLISRWICVDDNSSDADRKEMQRLYPFFEFYFKTPEEKGHAKSMNMIRKLVKTPFYFHMEDDFQMFYKDTYLLKCLDVLESNDKIGQVLLNINYAETEKESLLLGGELKRTNKFAPYYLHVQKEECRPFSCEYWPHFSLRPSLLRKEVLDIGEFDQNADHFEMEFANRYKFNYVSAFLPGVYSLHIGRLVSERGNTSIKNAYELNNEDQFVKKKDIVEIQCVYVINLDRRSDRWEKFQKNNLSGLTVTRVSAVDGKEVKVNEQILRIFNENDYNWRCGMIGCALSHFLQYIDLLNSDDEYRIILEDDAVLVPNFSQKLNSLLSYKQLDWDLIYLGHYPKNNIQTNSFHAVKKNSQESLEYSYGGTIGYIITKKGAEKLLNYIQENGMVHAIDTMQQKAADDLNVYYTVPLLVQGECFDQNQNVDTDIQLDGECLQISPGEDRVQGHCQYYQKRGWEVTLHTGVFDDDDWKRDEVLVCQRQKIEHNNELMIYNVDKTTFVVPKNLKITEDDVKIIQPLKFKKKENGEFVWKIEF